MKTLLWRPRAELPVAEKRPAVELWVAGASWIAAYALRFVAQTERPSMLKYVLVLPLVVGAWWLSTRVFEADILALRASRVGGWLRALGVAGLVGALLLVILRWGLADLNFSRSVIAIFVVLAALTTRLAARVRTAPPRPRPTVPVAPAPPAPPRRPRVRFLRRRPVVARIWTRASETARRLLSTSDAATPLETLCADVAAIAVAWLAASVVGTTLRPADTFSFAVHVQALPVLLWVNVLVIRASRLYDRTVLASRSDEVRAVAAATAVGSVIALLLLRWFGMLQTRPRSVLALFLMFAVVGVPVSRWMAARTCRQIVAGLWRAGVVVVGVVRALAGTASTARGMPAANPFGGPAAPFVWGAAVLVFNAFWYGRYLSFPLIGEDAAALYSFLVETVHSAPAWTLAFPVKLREGLGQPNVFVTATFDPFAWLMLTRLDPADAFRLSYVLRATVGWIGTYVFVVSLFRGARSLAVTSAFLAMLLDFTLTHPWGIPTFAGIFVATHVAVFPWLLWLYLAVVRARGPFGPRDIVFGVALAWFLMMYPIGSRRGVAWLVVFAGVAVAAAPMGGRRAAVLALGKLTGWLVIILFAPVAGLEHAWHAIAATSARNVFADELTSYPRTYLLPHLWHDVPFGDRLVVFLAVFLLFLGRRWSRPLKIVIGTGAVVVVGTQLATIVRATGFIAGIMDRLPRPFYVEFYLGVFYAIAAAYALHRVGSWCRLRPLALARLPVLIVILGVVVGGWPTLLGVVAVIAREHAPRAALDAYRLGARVRRLVPVVAVALLFVSAVATWTLWPSDIHPVFGDEILCREGRIWCRDPAGLTMGAGWSPIVEFLRHRSSTSGPFAGRAEFLLTPAVRRVMLTFPAVDALSRDDVAALQRLRARILPPSEVTRDRDGASPASTIGELRRLGQQGDLSDDVLREIFQRFGDSGTAGTARDAIVAPAWLDTTEVGAVVEERTRNFQLTGNGMLQRALPFRDVPVASSYEQALDFLYFLFWTRYVNEGIPVRHSINVTTLVALHPDRLALVGVRWLIVRDVPYVPLPALPRVFEWQEYAVYEIPGANTSGFGPTRIVFAATLADELRAMRNPAFAPRDVAVLPASERPGLPVERLSAMRTSTLEASGQNVRFTGVSEGLSLAVLPFRFSHCWTPRWAGRPGRIVRADGFLLGVLFDATTAVELSWTAGYVGVECLRRDAALVPAALAARAAVR